LALNKNLTPARAPILRAREKLERRYACGQASLNEATSWTIVQKDIQDSAIFGMGIGYAWNNWLLVMLGMASPARRRSLSYLIDDTDVFTSPDVLP
jgi:hypothetical protein